MAAPAPPAPRPAAPAPPAPKPPAPAPFAPVPESPAFETVEGEAEFAFVDEGTDQFQADAGDFELEEEPQPPKAPAKK